MNYNMINKILLAGLLILIIAQFSGCTVGKTVQLDKYEPDSVYWIDKIVVSSIIEGVILNNNKVINFDSNGGIYNKSEHSISGFKKSGEKAEIAKDSIEYIVIRPFADERHSLFYDSYIEKQATIDTLTGSNYKDFYPYLVVVKNYEKPGEIDTNERMVNLKTDSLNYHQFSFDEVKYMTVKRKKATMKAIRILSVIGAVTFVIVDNSDNF